MDRHQPVHDDRMCIVTVRDQEFLLSYVELDIICRVDKFSCQCPWEYIHLLYRDGDVDDDAKTEISTAYYKSRATA